MLVVVCFLFPFTQSNIHFIIIISDSTDDNVTGENFEITEPRLLEILVATKRK